MNHFSKDRREIAEPNDRKKMKSNMQYVKQNIQWQCEMRLHPLWLLLNGGSNCFQSQGDQ